MNPAPRDVVAANVRAEIARLRARQVEIAAALGMSQQALSRRLNGEVSFDIDELHAIAQILDTTPTALLAARAS